MRPPLPAQLIALRLTVRFSDCDPLGHVNNATYSTYLEQARGLGASLVVAVNADASVKRLGKGADRPLNPLADRMAVLAALACVDLVVPFEADTPLDMIIACAPDILVKGGDYQLDQIHGREEVEAAGGKVISLPFIDGASTTTLIERMKKK